MSEQSSILRPKPGGGQMMWKSTILAALLVVFAAVGCSSDEPTGDGGSQVPPPSAQACDSPVETAKITIADLAFQPNCFELPAGADTLTVENTDGTDHTFTMDEIELNEDIDAGETVAVDVSAINDGVWPFHCSIHPVMTGFLTRH